MQLSGDHYRQIGEAFIEAFDVNNFARMLRGYLNPPVRLDTITSERSDFTTIVYETLDWAQQVDRVEELVAGAKKANRSNKKLQALPKVYVDHVSELEQCSAATDEIRLKRPKAEVAAEIQHQIEVGEILLATAPPATEDELNSQSSQWHRWRQFSEQLLRDSFSTPAHLYWLKQLTPGNQDFTRQWPERAAALRKDIEQELAFLRNLLAKLDNYREPTTI